MIAVHTKMCGHLGGGLTLGRGLSISVSTKQNLNTRSSTESEVVGVDDMLPIIMLTCLFLLTQGNGIIENLLKEISIDWCPPRRTGQSLRTFERLHHG
jgi:hypothetical protein